METGEKSRKIFKPQRWTSGKDNEEIVGYRVTNNRVEDLIQYYNIL